MGRGFRPFGLKTGRFSRELRKRMKVFNVSIPSEQERNRNMRIRNAFEEFFYLRSNLSNNDIISA